MATKRKVQKATRPLVDPRLAKAIAHPMRVEILVELQKAPMSPNEYVNQFGGGLANVAYHFRELAKMDCLVIVDTQPRRGATEHFYEVAKRALFDEHDFAALPAPLRGGFDASIFSTFMQQGQQALEASTIDSQDNKHLTWQTLRLDKEGFDKLMDRLMEVFKQAGVEQLASEARIEKSGETPLYSTLGMFGFESPAPKRAHDLGEDGAAA